MNDYEDDDVDDDIDEETTTTFILNLIETSLGAVGIFGVIGFTVYPDKIELLETRD